MESTGDDTVVTGLPAHVETAWGLRDRPSKGPKRGLSVQRIVEAAIAIALADGLTAVSMSRVGKELGVSTMSLYRYVSAKGELLDLMRDLAYGTPPAPVEGESWRDGLARWAREMLAAYRRHPWALQIPIMGLPTLPNELGWMEAAFAATRETGLTASEQASVLLLVAGYVRNVAQQEIQISAAFQAAFETPNDAMMSYAVVLRKLADPQRFPATHQIVESGVFDRADDPDDEFTFGLDRILGGVEALVSARAGT